MSYGAIGYHIVVSLCLCWTYTFTNKNSRVSSERIILGGMNWLVE